MPGADACPCVPDLHGEPSSPDAWNVPGTNDDGPYDDPSYITASGEATPRHSGLSVISPDAYGEGRSIASDEQSDRTVQV